MLTILKRLMDSFFPSQFKGFQENTLLTFQWQRYFYLYEKIFLFSSPNWSSYNLIAGDDVVPYKYGEKSAHSLSIAGFWNLTLKKHEG